MSSSSHRYTDYNQRIDIPIHRVSNNSHYKFNGQVVHNEIHSKDTTTQWINDPIANNEKFRMKINVEGFNQNDVRIRVEGNKLFLYGERIENKSQGTSKTIIEKFYELPPDVDTFRPHVTYSSPTTMQVDFPSKHLPTQSNRHTSPRKIPFTNTTSHSIPIHQASITSRDSSSFSTHSHRPIYKFHQTIDDPRIIHKQTHRRSGSPALSDIIEEDHFHQSLTSTNSNDDVSELSYFPPDFNSDVFYQSIFQPEIFTDEHNQRYIGMKLNIHDYNPDDIKISVNDNDLIVQIEHTNFYKQITLPSNVDFTSLSFDYHQKKKLYITIKLFDEYSSIKYI